MLHPALYSVASVHSLICDSRHRTSETIDMSEYQSSMSPHQIPSVSLCSLHHSVNVPDNASGSRSARAIRPITVSKPSAVRLSKLTLPFLALRVCPRGIMMIIDDDLRGGA